MNEETFNLSIRKFLKMVGISSQREIEQAVARAIADGSITGRESFPAYVTLGVAGLNRRQIRRRDQTRIAAPCAPQGRPSPIGSATSR